MDTGDARLKKHLKQHGYSLTGPRIAVFNALAGHEPQSMAALAAACGAELDRATVYRTISLFERLGIVQRLQIGWKYKLELTDTFSHHHHHLTCLHCGKVISLAEDSELEDRLKVLAASHAFTAQGHQIEIRGLCDSCASLQQSGEISK